MKSIIIAITGASGAVYGIQALLLLKQYNITTYLIISQAGMITINNEQKIISSILGVKKFNISDIKILASFYYDNLNILAPIASGSFKVDGMLISPCSAKTLAGIATGYEDNLILRAAGVTLKERRPLVLMFRESPYSLIHLDNMYKISRAGAVILPTNISFYNFPTQLEDVIKYSLARALDLFGLNVEVNRWNG